MDTINLTTKQKVAFDALNDITTTEVLYGGAAGGGKSFLGCLWQIYRRWEYPNTRGLIGRSKLDALKKTTLNTFFEVAAMIGMKSGEHYTFNGQSNIITFSNGSEIILKDLFLYPSDPNFDSLGSLELTDCFIDECNQITEKAKNVVSSRIRYKLDEFNLVPKTFMTCNPAKNWVYSEFYKKQTENNIEPYKLFVQALLDDNRHLSKHYKEQLSKIDELSKQRLLYGNWEYDDDKAKLFNYDCLIDMFTNEFVMPGDKYITADIARFGSDNTVICIWDGWRCEEIVTLNGSSITETSNEISQLAYTNSVSKSNIVVDEDGVGGGCKDILKCKGFVNNSKALKHKGKVENYANLKSQCYFNISEVINTANMYINCSNVNIKELIVQEFEQVKQKDIDKDTRKAIIGKEVIKQMIGRSPDYSDAIMMRYFFELDRKRIIAYG